MAVDGDRLAPEGLLHEIGQNPAVIQPHPRPVGVEDAHDPRLDAVIAVIGHGDRLGEPFGLIVAAPGTNRIDVAPVVFALGVDLRVAVDLRRAGQQEPCVLGLGQAQGIVRAQRAHLEGRDGVREIIDRAGRAGEMQHVVHGPVDLDRLGDVVLDELESRVAPAGPDVPPATRSRGCRRR